MPGKPYNKKMDKMSSFEMGHSPKQMGHSPKEMKHSPMPMKGPYNMRPSILNQMSHNK